jgi:hypothetical protein
MEMLQAVLMRAFKSKQTKQKQKQAALVKVSAAAARQPCVSHCFSLRDNLNTHQALVLSLTSKHSAKDS